ncbi:MAG: adenylate/guanylate cyclase domain-containing protein, partial [Chromatiales bacterium]
MDVGAWLRGIGLGDHADTFHENGVDAALLPELDNEDLKDLGVARLADRKRLLKAIAELGKGSGEGAAERPAAMPSEGERRQVTVLFADIADFTPLSERLGAEATHALLNRYFEAADRIVEEFGGRVDKHMGDNVMAVFGAPVAHDNDPERAVRAALAIHGAAAAIGLPGGGALTLHVGIASGQVVASGTGSDAHREYTVTGESVNLAARLQVLAAPGQTLVSEAVQRRTAGRFAATALGPQALKGITEPVSVWRIEGAAAAEGRATPFVGRRAELGQCRALLEEVAATGAGQTILLRGAAGIGKTRLAEEIARGARAAGFAVHRSLVLDFGSRKGQGAIPALVRSLIGLPSSSTKEARAEAADAAFAAGAFAEDERVFLNDLLDLPQPVRLRAVYDAMDDAARRAGRGRLVAGLVAAASRRAPQLILVEDLHWADEQTLDRLAVVAAMAREHPVALLATTRPEGDPLEGPWRAIGHDQPVSIVNLGPLRTSEAREMAAGFARADDDRLAECLERAAGNPLFLEQLLQSVAESAEALVPGSIQSLVLARMDRLEPPDKRALQAASVFGQRFSLAALRHLTGSPGYDPAGLLRHRLVRPEGEDFLFAHALVRDGVYESILSAPRARLHLKAADWFAATDPALHAGHLELAGDARAPRAYLAAARGEMANYRSARAIDLLSRGAALAADPADRVELALALGEAQHDAGAPAEARAAFEGVLAETADDAARCRARLGLAGVKRITEDIDGALADLDSAQALAERLGLAEEAAQAHFLRGNLLFPRGDAEGCLAEHGTALRLAREAGSAELEAAALGGLADVEYLVGRYRSARERFTECVEVSRAHGFGRIEVANLPMVGYSELWSGDYDRVMQIAVESLEAARRVGNRRSEITACQLVGICCHDRGDLAQARSHAEQALALARRLGARRFEGENLYYLGRIHFLEGRGACAVARARESVSIARETGMGFMGASALGLLMLTTDDPAEREQARAEAEDLLAAGCVSHNHPYFRSCAIDTALRAGDFDEAERHANALASTFAEEGLLLIEFIVARGLALARAGRGERSAELDAEIDHLIAAGARMRQEVML